MKYYIKEIKLYECIKCGWIQKIWNNKVSQTKCSCGGKTLSNWKQIKEETEK